LVAGKPRAYFDFFYDVISSRPGVIREGGPDDLRSSILSTGSASHWV
jgi:hypothetical protein